MKEAQVALNRTGAMKIQVFRFNSQFWRHSPPLYLWKIITTKISNPFVLTAHYSLCIPGTSTFSFPPTPQEDRCCRHNLSEIFIKKNQPKHVLILELVRKPLLEVPLPLPPTKMCSALPLHHQERLLYSQGRKRWKTVVCFTVVLQVTQKIKLVTQ